MCGNVLLKNLNPPLPNFRVIALCFVYLKYSLLYSSHTPFPKFLCLLSINKTCSAGDINLTNLLVLFGI